MKRWIQRAIAACCLQSASTAFAAPGLNDPWGGLVLQVDVQHPGGAWISREVRGLRHASDEAGEVERAFVNVDLDGLNGRIVTLRCRGAIVSQERVAKTGMKPLRGRCYDTRYRLTVVPAASARRPRAGALLPAA